MLAHFNYQIFTIVTGKNLLQFLLACDSLERVFSIFSCIFDTISAYAILLSLIWLALLQFCLKHLRPHLVLPDRISLLFDYVNCSQMMSSDMFFEQIPPMITAYAPLL